MTLLTLTTFARRATGSKHSGETVLGSTTRSTYHLGGSTRSVRGMRRHSAAARPLLRTTDLSEINPQNRYDLEVERDDLGLALDEI
jgi:hypothetical protein